MTALLLVCVLGILLVVGGILADFDGAIGLGIACVLGSLCGAVILAVLADSADHDRLIRQCMADNHPEYECVSKLKQDVVPVFIPVSR